MALSELTYQSVVAAIAEHDELGRDVFLRKYGFGKARSYLLEFEGRRYDSKAIAGVAHRYATGRALVANRFNGGAATVQRALEALGFRMIVQSAAGDSSRGRRSGVTGGLAAEDINAALDEWRRLGRDAYLARYGGQPAERYVLVTATEDVDALALILGARALAGLETAGPWRGDRANVADPLIALGYRVDSTDRQQAPEVHAAEDAVQQAAGRERPRGGGQGFSLDQDTKVAVEAYAMSSARSHFEQHGSVVETATRQSWDYEVDIDGTVWHVEVKGTTGDPVDVILTPNEVAHARVYEHVALYVVSNIDVEIGAGSEWIPSGGRVTMYHPWTLDEEDLRPLGYKYRLPDTSE